jgi:LacI family gluconate utilization system Gnt-I transcriptional repressor
MTRRASTGNGRKKRARKTATAVTLSDVARLAGVSPITVSRVVNRPELVNAQTQQHVQAVIAQTGYVPNLLAGGLRSSRSRVVGAIVSTITHSIFVDTIQALTDRLARDGYQMLLGLSGYPATRQDDLVRTMLSRRPDAMFLTGVTRSIESRRRLLAAGIPVVETWDYTPTPTDMLVGFSHERIGREVAQFFIRKGYRRIAVISADDERSTVRRENFLMTLAAHNPREVPVALVPAPSTFTAGRDALSRMLAAHAVPDAILCSSDTLAHGVLTEASARGIAVPSRMAVMGFGDMDFAAGTNPPLSTVHIDRAGIGRTAAELLLAAIKGDRPDPFVIDMGFQLVERQST